VTTERFPLRVLGFLLLMGCLAFYDATSDSTLHRLGIPLLMALGAWSLVQNLAAVAIGGTVLAVIHTDLGAGQWIDSIAYPALAGIGLAVLTVIAWQRFTRRIARTHDARWSERETK